jgi:hypothetical protein
MNSDSLHFYFFVADSIFHNIYVTIKVQLLP